MAEPASETRNVRLAILGLSAFVMLAVTLVMVLSPGSGGERSSPSLLARINVSLNAAAGVCLLLGLGLVRAGKIQLHRVCMSTAFALSSTFLCTYLLHHAQVGSVPFRGTGLWRPLYFAVLIPHIVLAALIVPLALFTLYRGWTGKIPAHRRIARYTLPLWLFVSVSGVLVFWLLYYAV
jgi:putative membrane protein